VHGGDARVGVRGGRQDLAEGSRAQGRLDDLGPRGGLERRAERAVEELVRRVVERVIGADDADQSAPSYHTCNDVNGRESTTVA
jgi:hypothetical protein